MGLRRRVPVGWCFAGLALLVLSVAWPPPAALAGEGEIIILRKVPPRPAIRDAPPAPPLAVRTAPDIDLSAVNRISGVVLDSTAAIRPLSDREAASISAEPVIGSGLPAKTSKLGPSVLDALGQRRGGTGSDRAGIGGTRLFGGATPATSLRGTGGTIRRATGGLGVAIGKAVGTR